MHDLRTNLFQLWHSRIQAASTTMDLITTERCPILVKLSEDRELCHIFTKGLAAKSMLTPNEYFRITNYMYMVFVIAELVSQKWRNRKAKLELRSQL